MPIAMVLTLIPSFFIVASLLGTIDGGAGAAFPVMAGLVLLVGTVIGLLRFMRTLEEDVSATAPGEHVHEAIASDGHASDDTDHDLPMAA
jgi:hypothetical protein